MPVGTYVPNSSAGNGVTTVFPYLFKILDQTHIKVTVDGVLKALTADYTVDGVGQSNGGNVTMLVAPANGTTVLRYRDVPYTREEDYQANGDFREETLDKDIDLREMQIQQLAAALMRAFKAPISVTADQVLTDAQWAARALQFLGFDGAGNFGVFQSPTAGALVVSAYIQTLLDDASAPVARLTLGFPAIAARGDIIAGTAADTMARLAAGAEGYALQADSGTATGLVWVDRYVESIADNPFFLANQRLNTSLLDDTYGPDRWYAMTEANPIGYTTQTDQENGLPSNGRLTQSNATPQRMGIAQIVESYKSKRWRGKTVTFRPRVRISNSQAIRIAVLEWTGTADVVTSDVVNNWASGVYTGGNFFLAANLTIAGVSAKTPGAATLTDMDALTVTFSAGLNNIIVFIWTEAAAAQNVTLDIGRVGLVPGASGVVLIHIPTLPEILQYTYRYYEKSFAYATLPAQNVGSRSDGVLITPATNAGDIFKQWEFRARKRTAPTIVTYNPAAAATSWRDYNNTGNIAAAASDISESRVHITGTAGTVNVNYQIHATAEAEL